MNKLVFVIAIFLSGSLMATDCCINSQKNKNTACGRTDTAVSKDQHMMNKMGQKKGMKMNSATVYYTCPMESHNHIRSDKPGNCPECGMSLVAVESEDQGMMGKMDHKKMMDMKDATVYYTCPMDMHKHIHSNEAGKCPECGMTLVAVEKTTPEEADFYGCPMESHSHVRSDKPGTCDECGMNLKPMRFKK